MVKVVYIVAVEPYNAGYNLLQLRIKFKLLPILKYMYLVIYPGFSELSENEIQNEIQMELQLPSFSADQEHRELIRIWNSTVHSACLE